MWAVQVREPGGLDQLLTVELADLIPGPGEVLVRAHVIGVGRPDVLIRKGVYKWMPPLPAIPGSELAGVVEALGEGVTRWQVGDRVLVSARELAQRAGCYAQAIAVPQEAPYRLPPSVSFEAAVSLPNVQLALALMKVAGSKTRERPVVLITGASGGVAGMLCQVAKHQGCLTIGTSRSADKQAYARSQGFDHVVCTEGPSLKDALQPVIGTGGVDWVFDHLGGSTLVEALKLLAPLGTLVSYNIVQGMPTEDVFGVLRQLLGRSLAVRCFSMHTFDAERAERRGLMEAAIELMSQGHIQAPPHEAFGLHEVRKTHALLEEGRVSGKLILRP